jgi:hypothetical protein
MNNTQRKLLALSRPERLNAQQNLIFNDLLATMSNDNRIILPIDKDHTKTPYFSKIFQRFRHKYKKANTQYKAKLMPKILDYLEENGASFWNQTDGDDSELLERVTNPIHLQKVLLNAFALCEQESRARQKNEEKRSSSSPETEKRKRFGSPTVAPFSTTTATTLSMPSKKLKTSPPCSSSLISETPSIIVPTKSTRSGRTIRRPIRHRDSSENDDDDDEWRLYKAPAMEVPKADLERFQRTFGHLDVPPGWVGSLDLAAYMSLQRHLARERDLRYHSVRPKVNVPHRTKWKLVDEPKNDEEEDDDWLII